ncbi:hypothetical protein B0I35DRAFT_418461 [Stachybotrys elegans]|uniref:Uncharacterized protein n=1 Tax=Stachybotrys elegans TaxID=80388 RepID=A0A8K0T3S0_9HYPO|nr:hypothetical protein B0I35DRAFT_418461 [Stachybotrys elegans]
MPPFHERWSRMTQGSLGSVKMGHRPFVGLVRHIILIHGLFSPWVLVLNYRLGKKDPARNHKVEASGPALVDDELQGLDAVLVAQLLRSTIALYSKVVVPVAVEVHVPDEEAAVANLGVVVEARRRILLAEGLNLLRRVAGHVWPVDPVNVGLVAVEVCAPHDAGVGLGITLQDHRLVHDLRREWKVLLREIQCDWVDKQGGGRGKARGRKSREGERRRESHSE